MTYVIDRNVYNLYKDYFHKIDIDNIYFIDAEEHKKEYRNLHGFN